jgi:hypothetical protein
MVFPGEATFEKVSQVGQSQIILSASVVGRPILIMQDPSGKTHILKFSSSDHKYFVSVCNPSTLNPSP